MDYKDYILEIKKFVSRLDESDARFIVRIYSMFMRYFEIHKK